MFKNCPFNIFKLYKGILKENRKIINMHKINSLFSTNLCGVKLSSYSSTGNTIFIGLDASRCM